MANFTSVIDLSGLDGATGLVLNGAAAGDVAGISVASAGDINGDGYDDFIIGAQAADPNGSNSGASYVVFGGAGGFPASLNLGSLDGSNGFKLSGVATNDNSGHAVASAGDVNGDGYDDLIIGAYRGNFGNRGATYVVFGHAGGFAANLNLSTLDGTNGFKLSGEATNDFSGRSVASAGDVNGDGFDDLIIGADSADAAGYYGAANIGAAYVVFGHTGGFSADISLSTLNGTNGFKLLGVAAGDYSGKSVASAGDVNGDGYDDLIIGADGADPHGSNSGASYVVFGHAGGFSATISLSSLNGANGFKLSGAATVDTSGRSVASAGDVNGDGYDDLIIGAEGARPNGNLSGASYVVFGKATGFAANIDLSSLDGTNGFKISGVSAVNRSGGSVASAGDVNGDGFDDLIIGAKGVNSNAAYAGASYVVFGKAGGFAANLNLSTLDGFNGFELAGKTYGDYSGISVASAGDVNHDGYADLIIGASLADPHGASSGAAYIVFGHATTAAPVSFSGTGGDDVQNGNTGDDTLSGGAGNDTLDGLAGADNLSGGAGKDNLFGGAGDDTISGGSEGDWLDGGTGKDAMTGGTGDDTYVVDDLNDTTIELGGEGNDVVHASITWTLGANIERLILDGTSNINGIGNSLANTMVGNDGDNTLDGAAGEDVIKGGLGNDTLQGGDGNDMLYGGDGTDTLDGQNDNDTLSGGAGDDTMYGGSGADSLDGGADNDTLHGGTGNDTLLGGAGVDNLFGDDGNDILDGGTGADAMTGGLGDDIYYVDDTGDTTVEASGEGIDLVRATISWILSANTENMVQDGSDNIDGTGNSVTNAITGNSGNNVLDGAGGDDVLKGGNGADTLIGGTGSDILVGGAGADTFVVRQESVRQSHLGGTLEIDTVNDLILAQGDKLDLSAIDADSATAGDQAFHLVGAFTSHAGEMTLSFAAGITTLQLDVDGDGVVDYRMKITGDVHLDSGGWVL